MSPGTLGRWRRGITHQFTLGGSLSILNGFFWVCIFVGGGYLPDWAITAMMPLMLVLALPVGLFCLIPTHTGGPGVSDVVISALGIGINSLLWGHGLAWLIRRVTRRFG